MWIEVKKALVFEAQREGYGIEQVGNPVTVGELRELLEDLDDEMLVILSHDGGYTYGSVSRSVDVREKPEDETDGWRTTDEYWIS